MFIYNVIEAREQRQYENDLNTLHALESGDLQALYKLITREKLDRVCLHQEMTHSEFIARCAADPAYRIGFNYYLSKDSSKQSAIDEKLIFKGLDQALDNYTVIDLPNSGSRSVKLPLRKGTQIKQKSIDGLIFNDSLCGLIAAKIVIGSGGSQSSTFKELQYYAEAHDCLTRDQIAQAISHRYQLLDSQKLVMILLVDTDNQKLFEELQSFENDEVWVVSHIQLQERLNVNIRKETERPIFYGSESIQGRTLSCVA